MASEGNTSYTKIGFIVVAGIVAVAGSLFYFGGVRGNGDLVYAETCFDRSVSGLSVGSAVNFRSATSTTSAATKTCASTSRWASRAPG